MIDSMYDEKNIREIADAIKRVAEQLINLQNQYGVNFTFSASVSDPVNASKLLYDTFFVNSNITLKSLESAKDWVDKSIKEMQNVTELILRDKRIVVICHHSDNQEALQDKVTNGCYYIVDSVHRNHADPFQRYYKLQGMNPGPNFLGYGTHRFRTVFNNQQMN